MLIYSALLFYTLLNIYFSYYIAGKKNMAIFTVLIPKWWFHLTQVSPVSYKLNQRQPSSSNW